MFSPFLQLQHDYRASHTCISWSTFYWYSQWQVKTHRIQECMHHFILSLPHPFWSCVCLALVPPCHETTHPLLGKLFVNQVRVIHLGRDQLDHMGRVFLVVKARHIGVVIDKKVFWTIGQAKLNILSKWLVNASSCCLPLKHCIWLLEHLARRC